MAKKEKVLSKLNGHCAYCGKKLKLAKATCDHIVARSKGGGNGVGNLHPACRSCNSMKGAENVESFRLKFFWDTLKPSELATYDKMVKAMSKKKFYFEEITNG